MKRRKAVIKKMRQKESMTEAGQSTIGDGSRVSLGSFDSCESLFLFFSIV
jgi:hypothetical protein